MVLGGLSTALYLYLALGLQADNRASSVLLFLTLLGLLFGLAAWAFRVLRRLRRGARRLGVGLALLFAALFRFALLPAGLSENASVGAELRGEEPAYEAFLLYDNDIWRYLWDAGSAARGLHPYRYTPYEIEELADAGEPRAEAMLEDELWNDVYDHLSFRTYRSVYPPVAQALFRLAHEIAPGSAFVLKLLLILLDLGTCGLLLAILRHLRRAPELLLFYAWNPLAVKEVAGSGHVDGLLVFLLTASLLALLKGRGALGLGLFGTAVLAKWTPLALAPLILSRVPRRAWPMLPLVLAAGLLPIRGDLPLYLEGVARFAREWSFNSGFWAALRKVLLFAGLEDASILARYAGVLVLAAVVVWATFWAARSLQRFLVASFVVLAVLLLVSPTVMPWYLLWAAPLAALLGVRTWFVFCALSLLSYLTYIDQDEYAWWLWLEYGALAFTGLAEWWLGRGRGSA